MSVPRRKLALLGLALVMLAVTIVVSGPQLAKSAADGPISNPTDFRAFYCGGWALAQRADPYRTQPLLGCEQRVMAAFKLRMVDKFVLPAPLPPYALALFAIIAALPFGVASAVWFAFLVLVVGVTVVLVQRLSGLHPALVAVAIFAADGYASLLLGQVVPLVVCALCAAALAARSKRWWLAAASIAVAMIEPHVALPAALALFVLAPRARVPLLVFGSALGGLSLLIAGPALNVEYVTAVLPLHARSEVTGFGAQYSLSSLLWMLGVDPSSALRLGELSYVVMLVLGLVLARRATASFRDAAYLVVIPAALGVLGGVFVHIHQMAVALPLALMLTARGGRWQPLAIAALVCLAVPWETIAEIPSIANSFPAPAHVAATHPLAAPAPNALAEIPETDYILAGGHNGDRRTLWEQLLFKLPTWFGLLALVFVVFFRTRRQRSEELRAIPVTT